MGEEQLERKDNKYNVCVDYKQVNVFCFFDENDMVSKANYKLSTGANISLGNRKLSPSFMYLIWMPFRH